MGIEAHRSHLKFDCPAEQLRLYTMAPKAMKAAASMKSGAKPMTKGGLADALATESGLKKSQCSKLIDSLGGIAAKELKSAAKFTIPGVCMVKTRRKPATPAGK